MYLSSLVPALQDKFGTPAAHNTTPLQNAFGATFERNTWEWKNSVSSIQLVYALDAPDDIPVLTLTLDGPARKVRENEERQKADAAKKDM